MMEAYVQWVRPNGQPGSALEEAVFDAVADVTGDLPARTQADGYDAGTDFGTGDRDVSFWFKTRHREDLWYVAEVVRVASRGVGSVVIRKAHKPPVPLVLWWRLRGLFARKPELL